MNENGQDTNKHANCRLSSAIVGCNQSKALSPEGEENEYSSVILSSCQESDEIALTGAPAEADLGTAFAFAFRKPR